MRHRVVPDDFERPHVERTPAPTTSEAAATFPAEPVAVTECRHFVRDMLAVWQAQDLSSDAELLTSELVANAVRHAMSDAHVQLTWSDPTLRIAVHDGTHAPPVLVEEPDEHGYGLRLIASIAEAFGIEQQDDGKVVWCELGRPGGPRP